MIGKHAEEVLNRAVRHAFTRGHEYFTLEHVLLSLLEETEILDCISACGGSYIDLKNSLDEYLEKDIPKNGSKSKTDKETDADPLDDDHSDEVIHTPVATPSIQRLIQRALFHVQSAGKDEITPEDLFVAIFHSKDSQALFLLQKQGIDRLAVLQYFSHGGGGELEKTDSTARQPENTKGGTQPKPMKSALDSFAVNLNDLAERGQIDPLIGREVELERMIQTLCRRRKNNPLLVGEAGVGKTALAEGLALRIKNKDVPEILLGAVIYSLDVGSLLAGTKFRGDFEQRLKKILKELQVKKKNGTMPIVFIDEIHTIIGAGAVSGSTMDAANLLKPMLSRGEIQCIGSTTYQEYRSVFEKDHALARRFQKIDVVEPSLEESIQILTGLKPPFEKHHGVVYSAEAIRAAVELSSKHINDKFLPDKAIDVMDETGARVRLDWMKKQKSSATLPPPQENLHRSMKDESGEPVDADHAPFLVKGAAPEQSAPESSGAVRQPLMVTEKDIEEVVAKMARIPARSVSTSQKQRLKNLESDLKLALFGQDEAVRLIVSAIRMARSGLRSGTKPVGSFLFCGPTGVGKTELSKQLSHALGVPFLRFDMSEYMEKHTVSRLIGAPPGYVGFEQAGLLTDAVLKNPHSVILLDEIEKAHPDLWNILLQVMDHGMLTDNNGRKADFRNAILIMTSNVGTREMERGRLGVMTDSGNAKQSVSKQEVERAFSPEFRNRLDSIIFFNALDPVTVGQVVGKQILELESQLLAKNVEIDLDADVREWLAKNGHDPKLGARPMARLIEQKIKKPLAEEILYGRLENGGRVKVSVSAQGEIEFTFEASSKLLSKVKSADAT